MKIFKTQATSILRQTPEGEHSTHDASEFAGRVCEVVRPLTEAEADLVDVGPMFLVRFDSGEEIHAFGDELHEVTV